MTADAVLVLSFGGPEGMDDVRPFLRNVLRGRPVPPERIEEVAHHYELFGGVSPINAQNRALVADLRARLAEAGPALPVYWGNRNWQPYLADTLREMARDGVRQALGFVTSAFSSYSGCRQYLEDVERARAEVGPEAPEVLKLRAFYNHPRFVTANADHVRAALATVGADARLVFTAHSIPAGMAAGCVYEAQLREGSALVAREAGYAAEWDLAFQSRSGPPSQPWLEPDIGAYLTRVAAEGTRDVVVCPIGFVSDHMEVVFDLDTEAQARARELGLRMVRTPTASNHAGYVEMVRELVVERLTGTARATVGSRPALPDACAPGCCPRTA